MKYILKSGNLFMENSDQPLAKIKSMLIGPNKMIYSDNDELIMETTICESGILIEKHCDVRSRKYVLTDLDGNEVASAYPNYDEKNDPNIVGWPICHVPHVNRAKVIWKNNEYELIRKDSQNYQLEDETQSHMLEIKHRGLIGGWEIHATDSFSHQIICGLFIFCKYIEQENEFMLI